MTVYNWNVSRDVSEKVNYTEKAYFAKKSLSVWYFWMTGVIFHP